MHFENDYVKNDTNEALFSFLKSFYSLLSEDKYIARSDYKNLIENAKYQETYRDFKTLKKNQGMIDYFCDNNNIDSKYVYDFIRIFEEIQYLTNESPTINLHNSEFINKHLEMDKYYLDNVLKEIDPLVKLDDEQRRVILSDEDYTLVVAGAGAGKTTTIEGKVKYLVEKKGIRPEDILIISFTNKTVDELKQKINKCLKIDCQICTFHKVGYEIIKKHSSDRYKVALDGVLYRVIEKYLKEDLLKETDERRRLFTINSLILFFAYYIDTKYDRCKTKDILEAYAKNDIETLKSSVGDYKGFDYYTKNYKEKKTLNNEYVESVQEAEIANFLYLNNVDYVYHKFARFKIKKSLTAYQPDFYIKQGEKEFWLEHFGMLNEDLTSDAFNNDEEYENYKLSRLDKIRLFKDNRAVLIQTFNSYNDKKDRIEHLQAVLEANGIILKKRSDEEVYKKIIDNAESRYIRRLIRLIERFIDNFKESEYKSFDEIPEPTNVRTKYFLKICKACYNRYQEFLDNDENRMIDFHDMINYSIDVLDNPEQYNIKDGKSNEYKYIIIDEFQDISLKRFILTKKLSQSVTQYNFDRISHYGDDKDDLATKLSNVTSAKIIAVGDDWQSIYAFSGSRPELFKKFFEKMGYGLQMSITKTYRNSQELIDVAGNFVMKNKEQIMKELKSEKHIEKPVVIETYDDVGVEGKKGGKFHTQAMIIKKIIEDIIKTNNINSNNKKEILILGRYNFDASNIVEKTDVFRFVDKANGIITSKGLENVKIEFLTVHKSKGLGRDFVIIANAKNETYGFPSKIEMDPVLKIVTAEDNSYDFAEERRLFYVALTRTKNKVYIAVPQKRPSEFIVQLLTSEYNKYIERIGEIDLLGTDDTNKIINRCPICGYPLKYQANKELNARIWICSNDNKLCSFMTNNIGGNKYKFQICECPNCQNPPGYLIVLPDANVKDKYFLGCTNYKKGVDDSCHFTIDQEKWDYGNYLKKFDKGKTVNSFFNQKLAANIDLGKIIDGFDKKD